jgi:hypothetical protein
MFDVSKYINELEEKKQILKWLIDGSGIHCLPISAVRYLTKERICELYNVELNYFIAR